MLIVASPWATSSSDASSVSCVLHAAVVHRAADSRDDAAEQCRIDADASMSTFLPVTFDEAVFERLASVPADSGAALVTSARTTFWCVEQALAIDRGEVRQQVEPAALGEQHRAASSTGAATPSSLADRFDDLAACARRARARLAERALQLAVLSRDRRHDASRSWSTCARSALLLERRRRSSALA